MRAPVPTCGQVWAEGPDASTSRTYIENGGIERRRAPIRAKASATYPAGPITVTPRSSRDRFIKAPWLFESTELPRYRPEAWHKSFRTVLSAAPYAREGHKIKEKERPADEGTRQDDDPN